MSTEKIEGRFTFTTPVILAHPHLFEAQAFKDKQGKPKGEPKFGCNLVIVADGEDLKAMKALAAKVARAKWPTRPFSDIKWPFADGTKAAEKRKAEKHDDKGEYQRGKVVINAKSKYRPKLGVIEGGRIVDLETDDQTAKYKSKFFFGAEVFAELNFVAYDGGSNPDGVTAYLNQVLATGKGTKLVAGASPSETFKGYLGSVSAEDPTEGAGDDEIPF